MKPFHIKSTHGYFLLSALLVFSYTTNISCASMLLDKAQSEELIHTHSQHVWIQADQAMPLYAMLNDIKSFINPDTTPALHEFCEKMAHGSNLYSWSCLERMLNEINTVQQSCATCQLSDGMRSCDALQKACVDLMKNSTITDVMIASLHDQDSTTITRAPAPNLTTTNFRVLNNAQVDHDFQVNNNQTVLGSLQVNGSVITPALILTGTGSTGALQTVNLSVINDLDVGNDLDVVGLAIIRKDLNVERSAAIAMDLTVGGTGTIGGDAFVFGTITTTGSATPSDKRLKNIIGAVCPEKSLELICQLDVQEFTFKDVPNKRSSNKVHHGFVAQDIEAVMPNAVRKIAVPASCYGIPFEDLNTIDYNQILPETVNAIKAMNQKCINQESVVAALVARLIQAEERIKSLEQA